MSAAPACTTCCPLVAAAGGASPLVAAAAVPPGCGVTQTCFHVPHITTGPCVRPISAHHRQQELAETRDKFETGLGESRFYHALAQQAQQLAGPDGAPAGRAGGRAGGPRCCGASRAFSVSFIPHAVGAWALLVGSIAYTCHWMLCCHASPPIQTLLLVPACLRCAQTWGPTWRRCRRGSRPWRRSWAPTARWSWLPCGALTLALLWGAGAGGGACGLMLRHSAAHSAAAPLWVFWGFPF